MKTLLLASAAALCLTMPALADDNHDTRGPIRADSHAPIGVMGDHVHDKGEWMVSYRFMRMAMGDSLVGDDEISPEEIVTSVPNIAGMPPTLRVVPSEMTMDMHMFGAMYGLSDRITLMAMVNYLQNEMDHITFAGGAGTTRLGEFTTSSSGFGDTKVSALIKLSDGPRYRGVAQLGLSLPTGSIDESDTVLTPMNTTPELTLPYPMQLGSGTYDPFVRYTVARDGEHWGFGGQFGGVFRLQDNDEDYQLGDEFEASVWTSYSPNPSVSGSVRGIFSSKGQIEGRDVRIAAPVQTANPDFQGGERFDVAFGVNLVGQEGALRGHRLAAELSLPVYQDLNGPQMQRDWAFTIGWQRAFD